MKKICNADDLRQWAATAGPGEVVAYHMGNLGSDRVRFNGASANEPLHSLAKAALSLSDGLVLDLLQRRVPPDSFEYRAIRRTPSSSRERKH
jgi:hypothetical protein